MKRSFFYFVSLLLVTGIFSSCNELKKMAENASQVTYKSKPCPIEMHAGKVPIDITIKFPEKYFGKKVKLVITPILKADDGGKEINFPTQTIIGEKFQDNYPRVSYKMGTILKPGGGDTGQSFRFQDTLVYDPSIRMSDLKLRLMATAGGNDQVPIVDVKVCDGIITTPELVVKGMTVDADFNEGETAVGRTIIESISKPTTSTENMSAKIQYDMQQANVKSGEMKKEEINKLISFIESITSDPDKELKEMKISSYASPDGSEEINQGLVDKRGKSSQSAFKSALEKKKIKGAEENSFYSTGTTSAEDWDGFEKLVAASSMDDKELILRVLKMHPDLEEREKEIKKIAAAFTELRTDILPQLRRSVISVQYTTKAKEDMELVRLGSSSPATLKDKELLFAGFVAKDQSKKEEIYTNYNKQHPNNWKSWNNLAVSQTKQGKFAAAKENFNKVIEMDANNTAALINMGVIAMAEGDDNAAWDLFVQAEDKGASSDELGYNMGVILIKRGKYDDAVEKMTTNSFNRALAQALSGDNDAASSTLNSMSSTDDAIFYYLKAVVSARSGSEGDVIENMKLAVSKDNSLKDYAKNDAEFLKYFENADFKAVID